MKLQLFTFLLVAVFAIFIAAAPTAEPTEVCGCQNSCTISCVPTKGACNCPAYCDPKYSCLSKRTMIVERVAEPEVSGVPCGCTNDCILGCKKAGCVCPQYCDPKYLCSDIVAVPTALPVSERQVPCGCTNACKINCPTCICPEYCDPAYECKSTS